MKISTKVAALFFITACITSCKTSQGQETPEATMKQKTIEFFQAVNARDVSTIEEMVREDYIQHNPFIGDGRASLVGLFSILEQNGTTVENIRVIEDGNFVAIHNIWKNASPFGAEVMVSFDVLRFDEDGKIAEHWDALMPNTSPNPSGRTLTDGDTEVTDLDKTEVHRMQASTLFDTIINGSQEDVGNVVLENFHPDYIQHNPTVADGIDSVFAAFAVEEWVYHTNHKLIAEGNFVLSISEGTAKGSPVVFYDLLRFEDGKVAEHWDVIQEIPMENLANANTMFGFEAK